MADRVRPASSRKLDDVLAMRKATLLRFGFAAPQRRVTSVCLRSSQASGTLEPVARLDGAYWDLRKAGRRGAPGRGLGTTSDSVLAPGGEHWRAGVRKGEVNDAVAPSLDAESRQRRIRRKA